ncbi:hypothetical protein MPTK1_7g05810 [Marchantia polymorpha subsp. ruderalis]|uniref:PsbP C-terminal domain-containing protein n=2 Tax=Marchantia polymorpha TaxID=3197 RepID=A0A176WQL4_MARPO|nr:hypothetical protein AXG93_1487s1320 [Marchantia polymorpha subsp. ruderalis]PTQ37473.1 hypothetical protein MARPO_0057s0090 [Marchantia polymorpha]BBN16384.1 hypothetical protein Mp_7g05810 [Marchantia polymorpha subsp. ruderalis]|eukprot:PTQ37473.1 hypothetical protein MARPO_0057s0090 [Marchantia polymorpha]
MAGVAAAVNGSCCGRPSPLNVAGCPERTVELLRRQRRVAHGVRESRDCERNQLCGSASIRSRPVRLITRASSEDYREQFVKQGRREWLLSSATLAGVAFPGSAHGLGRFFDVAEDSVSGTPEGANAGTSVRSSAKVQQSVDDVTTWFRFRGEGFALRIPPGYQDVLDPLNEEALNSLYGERAKDRPFAARFASPDRDEILSVVIKPASQMQLSFYQAMDIKDFGSIKEAAPKFVPGGSKLVAARIINSTKSRVPRTYYLYEFVARDKHVAMSAGVAGGRVFVMGATAPESKWKDAGNKLRLAASSFYLP